MEFKKEHFLYLALALPVFMIAVVALGVAFSRTDLQPKYNFLYSLNSSFNTGCQTALEDQLHIDSFPKNHPPAAPSQAGLDCSKLDLYLYDFKTKAATKLTLDQAQSYHLFSGTNRLQSPDGFTIQAYCFAGRGPGWWWGADSSWPSVCLSKGDHQQRLSIPKNEKSNYPYPQFTFLGWIKDASQ